MIVPMKALLLRFRDLKEVKLDISLGSTPVRLHEESVRLESLSSSPISGGSVPKSGILLMLIEVTRPSALHVMPEKLQCDEGEGKGGEAQSERAVVDVLRRDDLSFSRVSRSE